MDIILQTADELFLDSIWATVAPALIHPVLTNKLSNTPLPSLSRFARDDIFRQSVSIYLITFGGIFVLYFTVATLSYYFLFDHRMMNHPRFLKNQIKLEIQSSVRAFAPIDALALPWFLAEVRGYSRLYENISDIRGLPISSFVHSLCHWYAKLTGSSELSDHDRWPFLQSIIQRDLRLGGGWFYLIFSALLFLWFTDFTIYLVHRWEHTPAVYKHIHKPHHKWIIPTPFASYAFHPIDGSLQSAPYHIFVFLFPLHKQLYLGLFVFVNLWTILIHDSELIVDHPLEHILNGPSHHTLHHLHFTCNYGQYFTWADRVGKTYRHPVKGDNAELIAVCQRQSRLRPSSPPSVPPLKPSPPPTPSSIELLSTTSSLSGRTSSCGSMSPDESEERWTGSSLETHRWTEQAPSHSLPQLRPRTGKSWHS